MKNIILTFFACFALATSIQAAAGDHDSQNVVVGPLSLVATSANQTQTIATITTHNISSANSYLLIANLTYDAPSGTSVSVEISIAGTPISTTVQQISGPGNLTINTTSESIATGALVTVQVVFLYSGTPCKINRCALTASGILGVSQ